MSLPSFPSTSGLKPSELHVYTIEECQGCKEKTKRDFKVGDYVMGEAGTCGKCQGKKMITMIYGEKVLQRRGSATAGPGLLLADGRGLLRTIGLLLALCSRR